MASGVARAFGRHPQDQEAPSLQAGAHLRLQVGHGHVRRRDVGRQARGHRGHARAGAEAGVDRGLGLLAQAHVHPRGLEPAQTMTGDEGVELRPSRQRGGVGVARQHSPA